MDEIAKGTVISKDNQPSFISWDGRQLPFSLLSSGTQELLPLFNVIDRLASTQEHREAARKATPTAAYDWSRIGIKVALYVEEPEANVFPTTQYDLVRLFAWLASEPTLNFSWVITTHSPYILSSFNNLIEAGQIVRDHPELSKQVAKILPEEYWIKDGDFKAYSIENGKLMSILSDVGMIEANYLDQVSEVIGNEFDQLLRLEYDHSEA